MTLNRRHKAILFVTLVVSGCALLLGAEVREVLGLLMLGVAFAWAIGSQIASKVYASVRGASGTFASWIRLPLAMALAGGLFGALLLYSQANPVLVVIFMCSVGIVLASLTPLPTQRIWLKIPIVLLAVAVFLTVAFGMISTDTNASNKYAERYGQLAVTGLLSFFVGFYWLSKGWGLIERGISSTPSVAAASSGAPAGKSWGQYISLFLGVLILTLWLGLLAWSASSNWAYAPEKLADIKDNNLAKQFVVVVLLASWPYFAWKNILSRESNADPKHLRRHRRTSISAGMLFVIGLSLATTYGIQNGNDRRMVDKIETVTTNLAGVGGKIGAIKQRDLQTTNDYIRAYAEIGELLPDFESKIDECADIYREARQVDESRGLINTQLFYKSHQTDMWRNNFEMLDLVRQADSLTKQEVSTAQKMNALPAQDQVEFWRKEFKPLLVQEDDLRQKLQVVAAKIQPSSSK